MEWSLQSLMVAVGGLLVAGGAAGLGGKWTWGKVSHWWRSRPSSSTVQDPDLRQQANERLHWLSEYFASTLHSRKGVELINEVRDIFALSALGEGSQPVGEPERSATRPDYFRDA